MDGLSRSSGCYSSQIDNDNNNNNNDNNHNNTLNDDDDDNNNNTNDSNNNSIHALWASVVVVDVLHLQDAGGGLQELPNANHTNNNNSNKRR